MVETIEKLDIRSTVHAEILQWVHTSVRGTPEVVEALEKSVDKLVSAYYHQENEARKDELLLAEEALSTEQDGKFDQYMAERLGELETQSLEDSE